MRASNVPISGPMTMKKALAHAGSQWIRDFKASKNYLGEFKTPQHNYVVLGGAFQCATRSADDSLIYYAACDNEHVIGDVSWTDEDCHCPVLDDDDSDDEDAENEPSMTITTRQSMEMTDKLRLPFHEKMPAFMQLITQMNDFLPEKNRDFLPSEGLDICFHFLG